MLAMMASMSGGIVASPSYTVCACLPSTASAACAAEFTRLQQVHMYNITVRRTCSDVATAGGNILTRCCPRPCPMLPAPVVDTRTASMSLVYRP